MASAKTFGYGFRDGSNWDGTRGVQWIKTDPTTVSGVGYVHAAQLLRDPDSDEFVAVGTSNGMGVPNTQCADHYDALWDIYVDYDVNGLYSCKDIRVNFMGVGSAANYRIEWAYCDAVSAFRWVLSFNSTVDACVSAVWHSSSHITLGIETLGSSTTARNLDVRFVDPEWSYVNYPSVNWSSPEYDESPSGVAYTLSYLSGQIDVYLPPWN
ncbi:MAG: hypothetical protein HY263_00200 [Chloroflexi bacterium]|nr:hypothetical protein [Chloroflexota bacterium]